MSYLIDTDILSYFFKNYSLVVKNFSNHFGAKNKAPFISAINQYEILSGLQSIKAKRQVEIFKKMFPPKSVLVINTETTEIAAGIFCKLSEKGTMVDDIDILIAASALQHKMTIVANNEKHFGKIPGLKIENWNKREYSV